MRHLVAFLAGRRVGKFRLNLMSITESMQKEWANAVAKSGYSEPVFLALNVDGWAVNFIHGYNQHKAACEAAGLTIPDLIPNLEITYYDDFCRCGCDPIECQNCGPVAKA